MTNYIVLIKLRKYLLKNFYLKVLSSFFLNIGFLVKDSTRQK